ncbi:MAG: alpha/beta hydrolase [Xanthomonadales bacterium]|nr:alpha/beta hydrolase [Xanthomonadales bacterium]NIN58360.1 alpha/beta hydrolase [Xanthomonadales bacterium]NIN73697.1 alpha/beta hydrolase [Xanthomonadales bacterium]NIO14492.1 alpha/beta hydrolase [Xanthomonadales bacterium]NIP10753.1 alpha/beta hydrolase [Xanthomonadales bacterium]
MTLRRYAELQFGEVEIQTHYRISGAGRPLLLLHPSPLSSAFMVPTMECLGDLGTVCAPDTPGYGASDPLPQPGDGLQGYVDWLRCFMGHLGWTSAGLYGSATGAQIAIELARAHPDLADFLVLDNAVHFTDTERADIMRDYFPDLTPTADGAHFQQAWAMADSLFRWFPWFDHSEAARVGAAEPPLALVNRVALAYLQAGPDYPRAYRAAFMNERAENLLAVPVPTRVIRWEGSLLKKYADRLDAYAWPDHIRMLPCGPGPEARLAAIREAVQALAAA